MKQSKINLLVVLLAVCIASVITGCKKSDACSGVNCMYNGVCMTGTCSCPYYAEGKLCDTLVRKMFLSSYSGNYTVSNSTLGSQSGSGTVVITEGPDSLGEVTMSVTGGLVSDSVHTTVSKSGGLYTPSQAVSLGTATGNGLLSGTTLHDTLKVQTTTVGLVTLYFSGTKL